MSPLQSRLTRYTPVKDELDKEVKVRIVSIMSVMRNEKILVVSYQRFREGYNFSNPLYSGEGVSTILR